MQPANEGESEQPEAVAECREAGDQHQHPKKSQPHQKPERKHQITEHADGGSAAFSPAKFKKYREIMA